MTNKTIKEKYNKIQTLRELVKNNKESITYYNYLKAINNGDPLYGWIFSNDSILYDTLEDLDIYQNNYIIDVLNVYAGELENILTKAGVIHEE